MQPNEEVLLEKSDNSNCKTKFSLIAVAKNGRWVNVDSQASHQVVFEALKEGNGRLCCYGYTYNDFDS